jgi:alpha-L-rhamnosidase
MELPGWDRVGYDDAAWRGAEEVAGPPGELQAQMTPPMRVTEVLKPVSLQEREPGVYVFDMGQNMTGWCRLKVHGDAGTRVTLRFAEVLREDGTLEWDTMLKARPEDTYTLKGGGEETYAPRFTYHGFRFVEVLGLPYRPDLSLLEGQVVHDDLSAAGRFACSNDRLTRIHNAARWGIRGNYKSIPTDCPQRAERHGWTGDRLEVHRSEQYFFQGVTFYRKWLEDIANSTAPDGTIGSIAPGGIAGEVVSVTWPGVCITAPDTMRLFYGDMRIIQENYPALRRFVERLTDYIEDERMPLDEYGDWCPPPREDELNAIHTHLPTRRTIGPLIGTSYFNRLLHVMRGYAELLGEKEDAARFTELAEQMKRGLNAEYLDPETAVYGKGSQTSYVLPLAFDLVPEAQREQVLANLVNAIEGEHRSHIGTGVIGGDWLMRVLTDNGHGDLAYTMATQPDYPGWGFMIESGATTIWELYNAPTADKLMNSRNHVMQIGDLGIWLYGYLAGIAPDPARPGFEHVIMRPMPLGDLSWVDASYASIRGDIASSWKIENGAFVWHVTVPPNTTATLYVPTGDAEGITESGRPAAAAEGLRFIGEEEGRCVYEAGSGTYSLRFAM